MITVKTKAIEVKNRLIDKFKVDSEREASRKQTIINPYIPQASTLVFNFFMRYLIKIPPTMLAIDLTMKRQEQCVSSKPVASVKQGIRGPNEETYHPLRNAKYERIQKTQCLLSIVVNQYKRIFYKFDTFLENPQLHFKIKIEVLTSANLLEVVCRLMFFITLDSRFYEEGRRQNYYLFVRSQKQRTIIAFIDIYLLKLMDCYYHSKQPLTNFCNNPLCSLPLCPKCISLHLSQSNLMHEMLPIGEAFSLGIQQLQTATNALEHQIQSLRVEYNPQTVLKDYAQMLNKYRREAIDQINRHYDYLQREILSEVSNRYAYHLQPWVVPLQNMYQDIQKHNQNIKRQDKSLQTLIHITSQQAIVGVQGLLVKLKEKKLAFKSQLPKLQDGQAGKLKMAGQRIQIYSQRQSPRISTTAGPLLPPLSGLDRIADLQARLHSLRYEC